MKLYLQATAWAQFGCWTPVILKSFFFLAHSPPSQRPIPYFQLSLFVTVYQETQKSGRNCIPREVLGDPCEFSVHKIATLIFVIVTKLVVTAYSSAFLAFPFHPLLMKLKFSVLNSMKPAFIGLLPNIFGGCTQMVSKLRMNVGRTEVVSCEARC